MRWLAKEVEKLIKEFVNIFTEKLEEVGKMKGVKPVQIYVDRYHPIYKPLQRTVPRR